MITGTNYRFNIYLEKKLYGKYRESDINRKDQKVVHQPHRKANSQIEHLVNDETPAQTHTSGLHSMYGGDKRLLRKY